MRMLQRMARDHRSSLRLCPLFINGELFLKEETSDDAAEQVDRLLKSVSRPPRRP